MDSAESELSAAVIRWSALVSGSCIGIREWGIGTKFEIGVDSDRCEIWH